MNYQQAEVVCERVCNEEPRAGEVLKPNLGLRSFSHVN